jgi:flagellar biosynthetic protein FlhB
VRSLFKILFLGALVYFSIRAQLDFLPAIVGLNPGALTQFFGSMAFRIFTSTLALLVVFAGIDYFIQWRRFRQQARMTKEEAKREQKEREGDPQVKARIRSVQRDMARKRMMKAIPTADVIITNPTHFAVAIRYNAEEGFAPRVVAKGADFLAERIKQIARENSIPTVENVILARTLYKSVKVGQMIPRSLYQAVAEVLAYVYKLRSKRL